MKKEVVYFGGGEWAEKLYANASYDVKAVIDNKKTGMWKEDEDVQIPYIKIDEYKQNYKEMDIYISSLTYAKEIEEQLIVHGIVNYYIPSELFAADDVFTDYDVEHGKWPQYLKEHFDKKGMEILEIGSRVQTGDNFRGLFEHANYTGFDIYEGENVDIVGDAHCLSKYFEKKFDLIFCSAVFEHLAMPWIVSLEIIKLLKLEGCIFIETHYSFSSHERPWHFFQFSENALHVLFPEKFGMECVKKGCSNLLSQAQFSDQAAEYLRGKYVGGLYCHSEFLGKKTKEISDEELDWKTVELVDVVGATKYPLHECKNRK